MQMVSVPLEWMIEVAEGITHDKTVLRKLQVVKLVEEKPLAPIRGLDEVKLELESLPVYLLIKLSLPLL